MPETILTNPNPIIAVNPLLAKVKLPGRVFQLPSKGIFYEPGVLAPDIKDGEIEVRPMSALAELKIRSGDLLYSGKIIRELCAECIPGILRPERLLTKDVDAVFCFLRVVTYGTQLKVTTAHDCEKAKQHEVMVDLEPMLSNPRIAVLEHKTNLYKVILSNGQVVHAKPPTYEDAMAISIKRADVARIEREGEAIPEDMLADLMVTDLLAVIESVEATVGSETIAVTNKMHIAEWIRALHKIWLEELLTGIKKTDQWGYDFTTTVSCPECGQAYKHNLELDPINFFFG